MSQRPSVEPKQDAEVVTRCLSGDRDAFGEIVVRYEDRIFATIYRILGKAEDARDLAQEAFLRAWSRLETFKEGARFSTWLYTIALNLTRSELRKRKALKNRQPLSLDRLGSRPGERPPDPADPGEPPDATLGRTELYRLALSEMERLEPEAREVIVLRDMQSLSYEQIAEVVDCPVGTVRSRLHRAREALRTRLAPLVSGDRQGGPA
jgi:RNA polymerase sigma-70 factor (ECF subfamily)